MLSLARRQRDAADDGPKESMKTLLGEEVLIYDVSGMVPCFFDCLLLPRLYFFRLRERCAFIFLPSPLYRGQALLLPLLVPLD